MTIMLDLNILSMLAPLLSYIDYSQVMSKELSAVNNTVFWITDLTYLFH